MDQRQVWVWWEGGDDKEMKNSDEEKFFFFYFERQILFFFFFFFPNFSLLYNSTTKIGFPLKSSKIYIDIYMHVYRPMW